MEGQELIAELGLRYLTAEDIEKLELALNESSAKLVFAFFNDRFERQLTAKQKAALRTALKTDDEEFFLHTCDKVLATKIRTSKMKVVG